MECNKDEAIRSRNIAEQKFLLHDLMGAKKFALKAQHLFPGLEGIPQLLAVLDVHIVAQDKVDGQDANWYGILQTNATADDATIRQQYRKLALILHPDKNKAVGAEGAFKLISEAWGVLSDKSKKAAHDARRGRTVRPADGFCNFTNFSTRSWPRPNPEKKRPTCSFACPSCQNHVQSSRVHVNDMVLCSVCHQVFEVNGTRGDSKPRGKSPKKKPNDCYVDGTTSAYSPMKADDPCMDGSAFERCGSDQGVPTSLHCDPNEPQQGNKAWNARPDKGAHDSSQPHSVRQVDGTSTSWHYQERPNTSSSCGKGRNTHSYSNFQFHWGGHRNRTTSNQSPTAGKATAEMVQNVYETVKRQRVRAQKEARDKAMKERIEAEKVARRHELRARRERKHKKKEEELKKQAKATLHAKKAFDKLFARECNSSLGETDTSSKASFVGETDAPEAGTVHSNSQDHFDINSVADFADQ